MSKARVKSTRYGERRKPREDCLTGRVLIPVKAQELKVFVKLAEEHEMSLAAFGRLALRNLRVQMEADVYKQERLRAGAAERQTQRSQKPRLRKMGVPVQIRPPVPHFKGGLIE